MSNTLPSPPHALMESPTHYSIVFNMLGVDQDGIGINVNSFLREITVLARKEQRLARCGFYWTFGVPMDARLNDLTTRYRGGALEVRIPKLMTVMCA